MGKVDPANLKPPQLAKLLSLPVATIEAHIERGAPTSPEGTVNLVEYAAWCNQQLRKAES